MKYYIVKARSVPIMGNIVQGLNRIDKDAEIVNKIEDCDMVILQHGWTRSKIAVAEKNFAFLELRKPCRESYVYTDKYEAHLN